MAGDVIDMFYSDDAGLNQNVLLLICRNRGERFCHWLFGKE